MARFEGGWFKADRVSTSSDKHVNRFYGQPELFMLWHILKGWANIQDGTTPLGQLIKRGELLTTHDELAGILGISREAVRRKIRRLKGDTRNDRLIDTLPDTHGLHIRICNYEQVCCAKNNTDTPPDTLADTQPDPIRRKGEGEKKRKLNNKKMVEAGASSPPAAAPIEHSSGDQALGQQWADMAQRQASWLTPDVARYTDAIVKLRRQLNLTHEGIEKLMKFIKEDDFWRGQAISPMALFKKSQRNGLRKIDNLLLSFKKQCEPEDRIHAAMLRVVRGETKDPWDSANYQ